MTYNTAESVLSYALAANGTPNPERAARLMIGVSRTMRDAAADTDAAMGAVLRPPQPRQRPRDASGGQFGSPMEHRRPAR